MKIVPRARTTDPETSHDAAASVENLRERQKAVYECMDWMGGEGTDEEIELAYLRGPWPLQSVSGLRTRRHELVEMGWVEDSGMKRSKRAGGRRMIIWRRVK